MKWLKLRVPETGDSEGRSEQKLEYIHDNPVKGKWKLVDDVTEYLIRAQDFTNWVAGELSTSDITKI